MIVSFVGRATVEEIALVGELANERIDLAEREGHRRMALEITADKLVFGETLPPELT